MFQACQREKNLQNRFSFPFYDFRLPNLGKTTEQTLLFKMRPTNHYSTLFTEEQGWGRKEKQKVAKQALLTKSYPAPPVPNSHNTENPRYLVSLSMPTQSRQAEVEDLFYINSYCKVKNLNKITLPPFVSIDPWKTNFSCSDTLI